MSCQSAKVRIFPSAVKERKSDQVSTQTGMVGLVAGVNEWFSRYYHELTVLSPAVLPDGPVILACNHTAGVDPLLIQAALPRLVVWMMAREYYDLRLFRTLFKALEAIPVDRDGRDMTATRAALRTLKEGRVLGIFPEGRISPTSEILPFQTGVALMAMKTNAAVVPAYLDGTQRNRETVQSVLRKCQATIAFGKPIIFTPEQRKKQDVDAATAQIRDEIVNLQIQCSP
jgi:1-acyl-sn-glycerol-3-phosphate acyltransferase